MDEKRISVYNLNYCDDGFLIGNNRYFFEFVNSLSREPIISFEFNSNELKIKEYFEICYVNKIFVIGEEKTFHKYLDKKVKFLFWNIKEKNPFWINEDKVLFEINSYAAKQQIIYANNNFNFEECSLVVNKKFDEFNENFKKWKNRK